MQLRNGREFSLAERLSQKTAYARTLQNQSDSPLLRLPGEIRNAIYEYVLSGHEIILRFNTRTTVAVNTLGGKRTPKERLFALSHACVQTWSETALMFFRLNNFIGLCRSMHHLPATFTTFSQEQCNAIQSIAIPICCFDHFSSTTVATVVPLPGVQRVIVMYYQRKFQVTEEITERVKKVVTEIFGQGMEVVVVSQTKMFISEMRSEGY